MKRISCNWLTLAFLTVCVTIICTSCGNEKKPGSVRAKNARAITIINQTGNRLSGYQVNVAGSGVEIEKGSFTGDSFSIIIKDGFVNDSNLEVVLVDEFGKVYARSFNVPFKGNTDAPITKEDRISQGFLEDRWAGFVEWFNKHK
jgi:hypothetical protein